MLPAVAAEREVAVHSLETVPDRAELLARYEHLREIGRRQISRALALVAPDALGAQVRRLHLNVGHVVLLDRVNVMNFVFDLAVHTAEMGRLRAIERYARSAQLVPGSDEARVLDSLIKARLTIFRVLRPHEIAGSIAQDVFRTGEFWIIDEGLGSA
jgi:hypothetical protein